MKRLDKASPQYYVIQVMKEGWVLLGCGNGVNYIVWEKERSTHYRWTPITRRTVDCLLRDGWIKRTGWNPERFELRASG